MNEDQMMFAEMLGIRKQPRAVPPEAQDGKDDCDENPDGGDGVDALAVQLTVVEEMAREKAELEEAKTVVEAEKSRLEAEKAVLEAENVRLKAEADRLERERMELAGARSALESENSGLKAGMEKLCAENGALEEKLARMGRALSAARRAAAEASKVEIGGRRW